MHSASDHGYQAPTCCKACGSTELHCCNGDGRKYTHRIFNEDGQFISGHYDGLAATVALSKLRLNRDYADTYLMILSR